MLNDPFDHAVSEGFGTAVSSARYFAGSRRRQLFEGEYRLLVAVLEQAIRSYLTNMKRRTNQQRLDFAEVRRWFDLSGRKVPQGLFAFESVCELLEIDANVVRKRLSSISICDVPTHRLAARYSRMLGLRRGQRRQTRPHGSAA
jgi:hypothetical protein